MSTPRSTRVTATVRSPIDVEDVLCRANEPDWLQEARPGHNSRPGDRSLIGADTKNSDVLMSHKKYGGKAVEGGTQLIMKEDIST